MNSPLIRLFAKFWWAYYEFLFEAKQWETIKKAMLEAEQIVSFQKVVGPASFDVIEVELKKLKNCNLTLVER